MNTDEHRSEGIGETTGFTRREKDLFWAAEHCRPTGKVKIFVMREFWVENHFPACKKKGGLLKRRQDTARRRADGGEEFAFTSSFACWSISTNPQAGGLLPGLVEGSGDPIHCGVGLAEAQNVWFDRIERRNDNR
jgi:hypothetical protein